MSYRQQDKRRRCYQISLLKDTVRSQHAFVSNEPLIAASFQMSNSLQSTIVFLSRAVYIRARVLVEPFIFEFTGTSHASMATSSPLTSSSLRDLVISAGRGRCSNNDIHVHSKANDVPKQLPNSDKISRHLSRRRPFIGMSRMTESGKACRNTIVP